ncbi:unnamed protein product [Cuscuta campestris]|uniref:Transmembrane protein n=1 Tax=Cuscuta campestris TaxID=132261 RepID=A0A484MHA5_9ASTE|nr:unnamed protein product [Cuscuta campestris]
MSTIFKCPYIDGRRPHRVKGCKIIATTWTTRLCYVGSFQCIRVALHFLRATVVARFFGALFLNSLWAALHCLRDAVLARFLGLLSLNYLRAALHFLWVAILARLSVLPSLNSLRPAVLARFFGLRFLNSLRVALHFLRAAVLASVLFIFFCFVGNCTSWRPANTHEYEEVGEHNEAGNQ